MYKLMESLSELGHTSSNIISLAYVWPSYDFRTGGPSVLNGTEPVNGKSVWLT